MSWKPQVKVSGETQWNTNAMSFETEAEAKEWAEGLFYRWTLAREFGAVEVDTATNPVNYKMVDGKAIASEAK